MTVANPFAANLIPEDVVNRVRAHRHLAAMDRARRAQLEREWLEAEASVSSVHDHVSETIKRRAEDEWRAIEETQRGE